MARALVSGENQLQILEAAMQNTLKDGDLVVLLRDVEVKEGSKIKTLRKGTKLTYFGPWPQEGTSELYDGERNIVQVENKAFTKITS